MTTITLPRAVAQQMLEALAIAWQQNPHWQITEGMHALRAALAQQAEPVQDQRCRAEPRSDGDFVCDCKIGECLGRSAALAQQAEPVAWEGWWLHHGQHNYRAKPLSPERVKELMKLAFEVGREATLSHQAEPVQEQAEPVPGAWVASPDGRVIYDDVSADDGLLRVSSDFENDEQRFHYAKQIVDKLNASPPQRKLVPLTEEEIYRATGHCGVSKYTAINITRAVELAHGIKE